MVSVNSTEFERLVEEAIDSIGDPFHSLMDNVVLFIEDRNAEEPDLLGLYEGIPLTERDNYGGMEMPDRITIYRNAICRMCHSRQEVVDEVQITVVHEIAHHFGIDDDRLHDLGWG